MRLYIDCDGVLTDGRLTIDERGEKVFKQFYHRDVDAIRELRKAGWEVSIVSADDWGGIEKFADKVGAGFLYLRDKGQLPQPYTAIGDSSWDLVMLERAEAAYCPCNADARVLSLHKIRILRTPGGAGVVAELARVLLAESRQPNRRLYA